MTTYYILFYFFFNDPATTEIYTLSLHDALPISPAALPIRRSAWSPESGNPIRLPRAGTARFARSEEHTSELQSHVNLVCRLLLEKKKKNNRHHHHLTFTVNNVVHSSSTTA